VWALFVLGIERILLGARRVLVEERAADLVLVAAVVLRVLSVCFAASIAAA
jgi:hypothetical protein